MDIESINENENVEQVIQLVKNGQANDLLESVIKLGKINLLKILIEHDIDLDQNINGDTPLTLAIRLINDDRTKEENVNLTQIVILLIESGADINQVNRCGIYPVLEACIINDTTILDYLLNHNVNLDVMDDNENTPLHYAAYNDCPNIIKRLVSLDVNLEAVNDEGSTPLNDSVKQNYIENVKILIEAGASISSHDLMVAINNKNRKMIDLLIEHGVDTNIDFGDTDPELIQYVKEYADSLTLVKEPAE